MLTISISDPQFPVDQTQHFINPKPNIFPSSTILYPKILPISRNQKLTPFASPEVLTAETPTVAVEEEQVPISDKEVEKVEVAVKQVQKPRLVLKFIWMEKNIGLALDQVIPGHGTVPLSPYYFWPRKDAWEEL